MRHVDRSSVRPPDSLTTPSELVREEMDAARTFYATFSAANVKAKCFNFVRYKDYDVVLALRHLFHDKCAYCESRVSQDVDVEHFRPKGRVQEEPGHPGYWWLAHTWENLLPSCMHCNQKRFAHIVDMGMSVAQLDALLSRRSSQSHGKGNQFPIGGRRALPDAPSLDDEVRLLIDPTEDDPDMYLAWGWSGYHSIVLPKCDSGMMHDRAERTISVFALNRAYLVKDRTEILSELMVQAEQIRRDLARDRESGGEGDGGALAVERAMQLRRFCDPRRPYSAMATAFVEAFVHELTELIGE